MLLQAGNIPRMITCLTIALGVRILDHMPCVIAFLLHFAMFYYGDIPGSLEYHVNIFIAAVILIAPLKYRYLKYAICLVFMIVLFLICSAVN